MRIIALRGGKAPLVGLAIGILLATALTIGAGNVVPGVRVGDPIVIGMAPAVVILAAVIAVLGPIGRLLRRPLSSVLRDD